MVGTSLDKINIVLDLDNTLISAIPFEELPKNWKRASKYFEIINMDDYYMVFKRPYLDDFLDWLFKNFNVSVWTAASLDYALFIVDNIISPKEKREERPIQYIFFDYHTSLSKKIYKKVKDLRLLWNLFDFGNSENTFIIDDLDEVYYAQEDNTLPIKPFEFPNKNSHKDKELLKIKNKLIGIVG